MAKRNYTQVTARFQNALNPMQADTLQPLSFGQRALAIHKAVLGAGNPRRALISAGIHGDEPGGVEALLSFIEQGHAHKWAQEWELTLVPCINPSGYEDGTRENANGIDLNRKFRETHPPAEVKALQSLFNSPYDLDIELHEDVDTPGYYMYQKEKGEISELGRHMIQEVSRHMPINEEMEIEEMPSEMGIISRLTPPEEMDWWPMALYAHDRGCHRVFTLETSIQFPMQTRVNAHLAAIGEALKRFETV